MNRPIYRTDPYERMLAKSRADGECLVFTGTCSGGYGKVWVAEAGEKQWSHRVAWAHYHGPIPDGLDVLHQCDNPPCFREEHLFLGDARANMLDAIAKGRKPPTRGDRNNRSSLTEASVRAIRRLAFDGVTTQAIAAEFRISYRSALAVVRRDRWAWVE